MYIPMMIELYTNDRLWMPLWELVAFGSERIVDCLGHDWELR